MNFLLRKHNEENQIAKIPNGLLELLADITREILRDQPVNIYEFIANYLDAMLITREHARISKRTMTSIYDLSINISDLMLVTGISLPIAEKSVRIIEKSFRQNIENKDLQIIEMDIFKKLLIKCNFTKEQLRKSQKIIQEAFKNYYFHEYDFKLNQLPNNEWHDKVKNTLNIYCHHSLAEPWQLNRAACIIQSAYRGYYTRKSINLMKNYNNYAMKIQSAYRGYRDRKSLKEEQRAAIQIQARFRGYQCRKSIINEINKLNEYLSPSMDSYSELSGSIIINQADKFDDLYNETIPNKQDTESEDLINDNNNVSSPKEDTNNNNNNNNNTSKET